MLTLSELTDVMLPHVSPGYIAVMEEAIAGCRAAIWKAIAF